MLSARANKRWPSFFTHAFDSFHQVAATLQKTRIMVPKFILIISRSIISDFSKLIYGKIITLAHHLAQRTSSLSRIQFDRKYLIAEYPHRSATRPKRGAF
jgi:hypothetical protein